MILLLEIETGLAYLGGLVDEGKMGGGMVANDEEGHEEEVGRAKPTSSKMGRA